MTSNSFSLTYNPIVCPAYCAEEIAFNPESQPENKIQREMIARVVAISVPFFFFYQICLYAVVVPIDLLLVCACLSSGIPAIFASQSIPISIKCLFSSVVEIPQKLVFGPNNPPNYFGPSDRYDMKNHRFDLM